MSGKSCFFIGHRDTPEKIFPVLSKTVEQHIVEYGVTDFFVGCYGAFDRFAARTVIAAKERHPEVTLTLLLPYHPVERPVKTPVGFDKSYYPPEMETVPRRFAIVRANRYMVDHVDYLIAYACYPASNALKLVKHVEKMRKGSVRVTNLGLYRGD